MLRSHVIPAVFKRNVLSYFSGVLGYLFIVVFVVVGAFLAFSPRFFTNNLANLDQLSQAYPLLLLFMVPAITMSTWADERKLGTDELLFTLPAHDVEILLGKYLAVVAVYTIALGFSVTHLLMLAWIGNPDWWLMLSTYFGYWIAGAALLSAGMFASVLTSSATVAFVLGASLCAIPVFIGQLASSELVQSLGLGGFFLALSLPEQLRDFTVGIIPASGLLYFVSFAAFMLYLNLVFISRRHWAASQQTNMESQFGARAVSLAVILISLNVVASHAAVRIDMTSEEIYSLSPTTRTLIDKLDRNTPITIQAFISPEVPRDYVPVRKRLVGLLRQYDQMAGSVVQVRFVDVEPYSEEADEARLFGIEPERILTEREGRRVEEDVFLGTVITSPYDEVIVPFFGAGSPIEYELTRSIRTVSNEQRPAVGILATDAQVMGFSGEWQIVTELKKQYEVKQVSADSPIAQDMYDVLVAVMPSSLTQPQMDNLVDYVKQGHPVLIFDDPYPFVFNNGWGVTVAPRLPKPRPGGMMGMSGPPPEQKADNGLATTLLSALEIGWDNGQIVWDQYTHPEFYAIVPEEYLFISPRSGVATAFNPDSPITSGLQEVLAAFSGTVRKRADSDIDFRPLLRTGFNSGLMNWDEFTDDGFDPTRMQPTARIASFRPHYLDEDSHVIAARLKSNADSEKKIDAVFVADLDLISDWFFYERSRGETNLELDNVTFVLNAVDVLAGDDSFLDLRKRRAVNRTLVEVEKRTAEFIKQRNQAQEKADREAELELEAARQRFAEQRTKIEEDSSIDDRQKRMLLQQLQAAEQRRLEVAEANIERDKQGKIEEIKAQTQRQIRATEDRIRYFAVAIPPIPAILLGVMILSWRLYDERREIDPERRVPGTRR